MSNCSCSYISIIVGIIFGVVLGILSALGFVGTGVIFWVYIAIGVFGILLTPVYGLLDALKCDHNCFGGYRRILLVTAVGAVIFGFVGTIVAPLGSVVATAVIIALATFFAASFLGSVICFTQCIGRR